ncbi:MAG: hypothetical protein LBC89_04045 [Bacteroidales bacterium]|jgi:hypothetical protein|nr:hypothetical protein [Bacteroidales bacterium]
MKTKYLFALLLIFSLTASFSQNAENQTVKEKHHYVYAGYGDAVLPTAFGLIHTDKMYGNFYLGYMYYPVKYIGAGLNFVSYFGKDYSYYYHSVYNIDGSISDESIRTPHNYYSFAIAPEIRGRYVNKKYCSLYSAGSIGFAYNATERESHFYWQLTFLGCDIQLGKNNNFVFGMELGAGMKGFISGHIGWRF